MLCFPNCSTVIRGAPRVVIGTFRFSQACRRHSQTCRWRTQACRRRSQVLPGAPKVLSSALRCSQTCHNHSHGTPVPVISDSSYSEGWTECPCRVWYSPEIQAWEFMLHIISDTTGGFQRLKYTLLMYSHKILSHQWFLGFHNHKVFHQSFWSLLQSQDSRHHNMACILLVSLYIYKWRYRDNKDELSNRE